MVFGAARFYVCILAPEPPTCDYASYCAIVDCSKTGAAALCPDQCSNYNISALISSILKFLSCIISKRSKILILLIETTKTIKIRTESDGYENSYAIGTCVSTQQYATRQNYEEECSLAAGTYNLDCKCTYGDGWDGGYVEIDGVQYCKDFTSGHSKTVSVTW